MFSVLASEKFWGKICFDPAFHPGGRYVVYRDLVWGGMWDAISNVIPVTRRILTAEELDQVLLDFLEHGRPKSVVLRELALEFADYLRAANHPLSERYPYLGELVHYEVLEIVVRFAPDAAVRTSCHGDLQLSPAVALGLYTWPVHFISAERKTPSDLPKSHYALLLWREEPSFAVKFMELNPLVAALVKKLQQAPQAPEPLLKDLARDFGIEYSAAFVAEGQRCLDDLCAKGIVLSF